MAKHDALASPTPRQADPALAQNDATASLQSTENTAETSTTHATASSRNNALVADMNDGRITRS